MVDAEGSIVINQAFVEARGWSEPIGKAVRIDSTMYLVAGVVENFLPHPMIREIPLFFRQSDSQNVQYLSIRMHPGTSIETARALEAAWERLIPSAPFNHFFQNEVFDIHYTSYSNLAQAFGYIAALALLISCMGLFGLASQNVARRQKEVSIRKVLGASVSQITYLVNRGFITMLVLAAVVASAVCYFGLSVLTSVVEVKAIHMPMRLSLFLVSYTLIFSTAALSVAMQARKLVRANPADVLRNE
jgi:ABC-type antimicrobial peptide transport system permease subunit